MKSWILFVFISLTLVQTVCAGERYWFEKLYRSKKLEREFARVSQKYNDNQFKRIFNQDQVTCETSVLANLNHLKTGDIKYALFLANKKGLIDEVELDILLIYSRALEKQSLREPDIHIQIRQGQDVINQQYDRFTSSNICLKDLWKGFSNFIATQVTLENFSDQDVLTSLNYQAWKSRKITSDQYKLLEMMNDLQTLPFSISDYRQMRQRLRQEGFDLNSDQSAFERDKSQKKKPGLRHRLYKNYTLLQMKEMLALLERFSSRSEAESSSIIFYDQNAQAQESISLEPTEQLRLSMKLFSREKKELLLKNYFMGKGFSYRDLISLAYETKQIDEQELDFLKMLERETQKRSFIQNVVSTASRYSFVATLLVGPTAGFAYALGITIANNYLNKDEIKLPEYEHDIFYGNCQAGLR